MRLAILFFFTNTIKYIEYIFFSRLSSSQCEGQLIVVLTGYNFLRTVGWRGSPSFTSDNMLMSSGNTHYTLAHWRSHAIMAVLKVWYGISFKIYYWQNGVVLL